MKVRKGVARKKYPIFYWLYLFVIVIILLEIALRIYNPFHLRLKGDKILLPVNQSITIRNQLNPRLDKTILNTRNSAGFRGPEIPILFNEYLSIITVGGSTTECRFLSDNRTWPFLVGQLLQNDFRNVWVNNAGMDGHSSFGHQVLLQDHLVKVKPKVILFLIGINDVENDQPTFHDKLNTKGAFPSLKHYLYNNSEVLNVVINLFRGWKAQKHNNTTQQFHPPDKNKTLSIPDSVIAKRLARQSEYLPAFQQRIIQLIDTCKTYGIDPIMITQPDLYGYGVDSVTKADLAIAKIEDGMNGKLMWQLLEVYNSKTKQIGDSKNVAVIDLAHEMPKNSWYYYDHSHFTNEGALKVAEIVALKLKSILREKYPDFFRE